MSTHEVAEKAPIVPHCAPQAVAPRFVARWTYHPARYLMGVL